MIHAFALALALALDALIGEPDAIWKRIPHPAVLMGRAVGWADRQLNHGEGRVVTGAVTLAGLIVIAWVVGDLVASLGWVAEALAAAILLAHRSLVEHVKDVANALSLSVEDGRAAVARIVGRDTADMDEPAVARAAIESAAENFSDGVIAPAFWFLLLGLPGMLIYKMVNTADSMIGYRTPEHEAFGKAAARLDDVLNWIPARLTAVIIHLVRPRPTGWAIIRRDAGHHRSPNAGWPEAAMAVHLGVALAGPRSYHGEMTEDAMVNPDGDRDIDAEEIDAAVVVLWRSWAATIGFVVLIAIVS
jgi:adenosylcobinamide-phosphate synthase